MIHCVTLCTIRCRIAPLRSFRGRLRVNVIMIVIITIMTLLMIMIMIMFPRQASQDFLSVPQRSAQIGRGDDTVGTPHRAQSSQFELFELILLLKVDKQITVEQFEATVSQSAVPSPLLEVQVAIAAVCNSRTLRDEALRHAHVYRSHCIAHVVPRSYGRLEAFVF